MAQGSPLIRGDELLFYFGFGATRAGTPEPPTKIVSGHYIEATGLATLRRDGFASMEPRRGPGNGVLLTRPLLFSKGRVHLFVNVVLPSVHSSLRAEVMLDDGPASFDHGCASATFQLMGSLDSTRSKMTPVFGPSSHITGVSTSALACLAERPVRIRFNLTGASARLYAFWLSAKESGRSAGYLAGGEIGKSTILDVE